MCLCVRLPSVTLRPLFFSFLERFITIISHCRYKLPLVVVSRLRYTPSAIYVRSSVHYGRVTLTLLTFVRHVCNAAVTQYSAIYSFLHSALLSCHAYVKHFRPEEKEGQEQYTNEARRVQSSSLLYLVLALIFLKSTTSRHLWFGLGTRKPWLYCTRCRCMAR